MNTRFQVTGKAQGKEGTEHLIWKALSALIAGGTALVVFLEEGNRWLLGALVVLTMIAVWFLWRTIIEVRSDTEWAFSVEDEVLRWRTYRDGKVTLDGEITISEIRSLIYHPPGEGHAALSLELSDGSTKILPSLTGIPDDEALLALINFWRAEYAHIPIRNLGDAKDGNVHLGS